MARHPSQRLASPSRSASLIWHILGVASFSYNFWFLTTWANVINESYGWHFQYLTILGLSSSLVSFISAVIGDVTLIPAFFDLKNYLSVVTTPMEVVISVLYWGLRFIDPNLLMPPDESFYIPLIPDLGFHLAPALFLAGDLILFSPPWTIPVYSALTLSTALTVTYWYWVELCFSKNGWYPYPIFDQFSTQQRALLFALAAAICTLSSVGLKWVYAKVNGQEKARREAYKPLKKMQ